MAHDTEKTLLQEYSSLPVFTIKVMDEELTVRPFLLGLKQPLSIQSEDREGIAAVAASKNHKNPAYKSLLAIRYQINDDDENPVYADNCSIVRQDEKPSSEKDAQGNMTALVSTVGYARIRDTNDVSSIHKNVDHSYATVDVRVLSRDLRSIVDIRDRQEINRYLDLRDGLKTHVQTLLKTYDELLEKKGSTRPKNIEEIKKALQEANTNLEESNPDPIYYANLLLSIFPPFGASGIHDTIVEYIGRSTDTNAHLADAVMLVGKYGVDAVQRAIATDTMIDNKVIATVERMQAEQQLRQRRDALNLEITEINKQLGEDGEEDSCTEFENILKDPEKLKFLPQNIIDEAERTISSIRASSESQQGSDLKRLRILLVEYPFGDWKVYDKPTLSKAREILDSGHYGLSKPKQRLIEQIAVDRRNRNGYPGKPILLVGPPGVGKTSLFESIAKAMGRKLATVQCSGFNDPQVLSGFDPTYQGSRPGRILDAIIKSRSEAPLLAFDEIDKMGKKTDQGPSPQEVLIKVTDPKQNRSYTDDFVRVEIDLSSTKMIASANDITKVDEILLNRFEVIFLGSYDVEDKINIARKHLIPSAMKEACLKEKHFSIEEDAIRTLIEKYTNEGGVRGLEARVKRLTEITALKIGEKEFQGVVITEAMLSEKSWLGEVEDTREKISPNSVIGEVNGLYWSENGGGLLKIQVASYTGKGKLIATGNLMATMKESPVYVMAAIRSNLEKKLSGEMSAEDRKAIRKKLKKSDFIVHVPDAATPKDGPSAGVAIMIAMTSEILQLPVSNLVALTGEIDIHGNVRSIGGLPEKLKGALEAGATTVIVPKEDEKQLKKVALNVRQKLEIRVASHIDEVLLVAIPDIKTKMDIQCAPAALYKIPQEELDEKAANDNKQKEAALKGRSAKARRAALASEFSEKSGTGNADNNGHQKTGEQSARRAKARKPAPTP